MGGMRKGDKKSNKTKANKENHNKRKSEGTPGKS